MHECCASEADRNVGEAGLEADGDEQTGRNESEPHLMSLDKFNTGASRAHIRGVKADESRKQTVKTCSTSGGVSVDSTSGSEVRVNWENSGNGR